MSCDINIPNCYLSICTCETFSKHNSINTNSCKCRSDNSSKKLNITKEEIIRECEGYIRNGSYMEMFEGINLIEKQEFEFDSANIIRILQNKPPMMQMMGKTNIDFPNKNYNVKQHPDIAILGKQCKLGFDCNMDMGVMCNSTSQCDFWGEECVSNNECVNTCCEGGWCLQDEDSCKYLMNYRVEQIILSVVVFLLFLFAFSILFYWFIGRHKISEIDNWILENERLKAVPIGGDIQKMNNLANATPNHEMVVDIKHNQNSPLKNATKKKINKDEFQIKPQNGKYIFY